MALPLANPAIVAPPVVAVAAVVAVVPREVEEAVPEEAADKIKTFYII